MSSTSALRIDSHVAPSPEPRLGGIYRDANNHSFIVLRVNPEGVFVEYADGTTRSVSATGWLRMAARAAVC